MEIRKEVEAVEAAVRALDEAFQQLPDADMQAARPEVRRLAHWTLRVVALGCGWSREDVEDAFAR